MALVNDAVSEEFDWLVELSEADLYGQLETMLMAIKTVLAEVAELDERKSELVNDLKDNIRLSEEVLKRIHDCSSYAGTVRLVVCH